MDGDTLESILIFAALFIIAVVQSLRVSDLKNEIRKMKSTQKHSSSYYEKAYLKLRDEKDAYENLDSDYGKLKTKYMYLEEKCKDAEEKYKNLSSKYLRAVFDERMKCRAELYKTVEDYIKRSPFSRSAVFSSIDDYTALIKNPRFKTALEDDTMRLVTVPEISAKVRGQNGGVYDVSLDSCTCMDFQTRHKPCKHMYRLAIFIGALGAVDQSKVDESLNAYYLARDKAAEEIAVLKKERALAKQDAEKRLEAEKKYNAAFRAKLSSKGYNTVWLAKMYSDYYDMFSGELIDGLNSRIRPAKSTAAKIESNYRREMKELAARAKRSEDIISLYEAFFPNLSELCDMTADDIPPSLDDNDEAPKTEYESMRKWLSRSEYDLLPTDEKYQLALDNYKHRRRSNWEAGIDFERYICYLYEQRGYRVICFGALNGLADLGRDLYAIKGDEVLIIQCKRWAAQKLIHEKHVYQLFGTVTDYSIDNPQQVAKGLLISTCELSDKAKEVAARVGIEYQQNTLFPDYPLVKCNINRASGEKIYHLPFDQQYDTVHIEPEKGEFYAWSVKEAERKGFRRAHRHAFGGEAARTIS